MTLRIAFSGSGGTGKTTMSAWLAELLQTQSSSITVLPSATRYCIDELGYSTGKEGDSWMALHSATIRLFWAATCKSEVLISERCALDEVAYQAWYVEKCTREGRREEISLGTSVYHILLQQSLSEIVGVWDFIYIKRPLLDVPIEDDGVRSLDRQYQLEVDEKILQTVADLIRLVPIASEKIRVLPLDNEDCRDFLREEMSEWMTKLRTS